MIPEVVSTTAANVTVSTDAEKRQYLRHHSNIPITVCATEDLLLQSLNNIGEGGLSFDSETYFAPNSSISMVFHTPFDFSVELLRVFGRVAWCRNKIEGEGYEVGVEFINPSHSPLHTASLIEEMYRQFEMPE